MRRAGVAGAIAAIWAGAAAVSLWLAAKTAVGPVVVVISRRHAEGVHVGDIGAVAVSGAWALWMTVVILRWARRHRQ